MAWGVWPSASQDTSIDPLEAVKDRNIAHFHLVLLTDLTGLHFIFYTRRLSRRQLRIQTKTMSVYHTPALKTETCRCHWHWDSEYYTLLEIVVGHQEHILCLTIPRTSDKGGGDLIHKGILFWREMWTFIRCTGIYSLSRAVIWIPQFTANKSLSVITLCSPIHVRKKSLFHHIFDIWAGKKKRKKCALWKKPHHRSNKKETGAAGPAQQLPTCRSFSRQTSQQECSAEISHCQCSMSMAWSQC